MENKVLFVNKIKNQNNDSLAFQIYNQQLKYKMSGLVQEVVDICDLLNIPNITKFKMDQLFLKRIICESCEKEYNDYIFNMLKQLKNDRN